MNDKSEKRLLDELQMRYPTKSPEEIVSAAKAAGINDYTDVGVAEVITSELLRKNNEFRNKLHYILTGAPLYRMKTQTYNKIQ
jgi:hypothetical protein